MKVVNQVIASLLIVFIGHTSVMAQPQGVDTFRGIALLVPVGDKFEDTDAVLRLEGDRLVIQSKAGQVLNPGLTDF